MLQAYTGSTSGPFRELHSLTWVEKEHHKGKREKKYSFSPLKAIAPYSNKFQLIEAGTHCQILVFSFCKREGAWMSVLHHPGGVLS